MRKLKWILGGLFAFVAALLVTGYAIIVNYPVEDVKRLIQEEAKALTGRELKILGAVEMEVSLTPSIVLEDVHFQDADWAGGDDMVSMSRFEVQVELWPLISGEIAIKRFVMIDPVIVLRRDAKGLGNWELEDRAKAAEAAEKATDGLANMPSFQSVSFRNAQVTFIDAANGDSRKLTLESLDATGSDLESPIDVTAKGALEQLPFDLAITLASVRRMASGEAFPAKLEGRFAGASLRLDGVVGPPAGAGNDFRLWLDGDDLQALGTAAGIADLPAGAFSLEALVQQKGPKVLSLPVFKGSLPGVDFSSTLVVDLERARPHLTGDLHAGHLVLPAAASDNAGGAAGGSLFPSAPLPLASLTLLDATLSLTVDRLTSGDLELSDIVTSLSLDGGRLKLDPLSLRYRDATVDGSLELDGAAKPPALALKLQGKGFDLAEASDGALTGSLAIDLDLRARGDSPKAMAASLSGRSALSSGSGKVADSLASAAALPLANLLGPLFGDEKEVRLNCLVNHLAWKDGIGSNKGTALDASTFSVVGNGTIDLRSETIDFYIDALSKHAALVGVTVPVTVTGPLASPSIRPDPAGTALGLAKTAGLIVFPPAGLAAIIGDHKHVEGDNACVAAVQAVEKKGGPASFFEEVGKATGDAVDGLIHGAGEAVEDTGEAIGEGIQDATDGIKSLFGN